MDGREGKKKERSPSQSRCLQGTRGIRGRLDFIAAACDPNEIQPCGGNALLCCDFRKSLNDPEVARSNHCISFTVQTLNTEEWVFAHGLLTSGKLSLGLTWLVENSRLRVNAPLRCPCCSRDISAVSARCQTLLTVYVHTFVNFVPVGRWIELDPHDHDVNHRIPRMSAHEQSTRPRPSTLTSPSELTGGIATALVRHRLYTWPLSPTCELGV